MKAIVPIGGRGTRMRPLTFSANKHFIPVANKLLIEYPIDTITSVGITEIAITYNPGQLEYAQDILGDGSQWGVTVTYILQEKPKGLANIVEVCREWVGDDKFIFHLGDNIFVDGIADTVAFFEKSDAAAVLMMLEHPENTRLGVPYFSESGALESYTEKPDNPPHSFAVPGVYFFTPKVFEAFDGDNRIQPSSRGEYEVGDLYNWLIAQDELVEVHEYDGTWLDPGKFDDWLDSNRYLLDQYAQSRNKSELSGSVTIEGRVDIGENCKIEHSLIRGPVRIGNNVTVTNAFVGPYTSIFDNCILEYTHIENSVLMKGVTVKNTSKNLDTCLLGPHSEVIGDPAHDNTMGLFLGELSKINL